MLTLLIIFANSAFVVVNADIVVQPRDTDAVIGHSTYFDCESNVNSNAVNWHHYPVGAKHHEDICLYCLGRIHPGYKDTFEVEQNVGNNRPNYRLIIKSVQRENAGVYMCQDNGGIGESASAQLVVLESSPTCTSNMKPDGVLGPNDCGLQPDTLQMSCHVSYHGNIPPAIKWRKTRTEDPITQSFCHNTDNQMTCNLTMTVDLGLNGASYICETNRSTTTQYKCASDMIRVIYAKINNSTKEMTEGDEEKVYCSVNSSLSCRHTWMWFDGVHEEAVCYGSPLIAVLKPGWHKCEAECNIRDRRCTLLSKLVHVSEPKSISTPVAVAVSSSVLLAVEVVSGVLVYVYCRKGTKTKKNYEQTSTGQDKPLLKDESGRTGFVKQYLVVTTKSAMEKGLPIRGMTIFGEEIFVVTHRSSEVEVFDCNTMVSKRHFKLKNLIRPADIGSCNENRRLYIMDWKRGSTKKEVLCAHPFGNLLHSWKTGDDFGDLISVTKETNIIVTFHRKNEFDEYSPRGILMRKISLQGAEAPIHAIKLTNGDFMVSCGDASHLMHRVCIVDAYGKVKKSFGEEQGADFDHMDHPMNLATFSDGSVAVLDNGNRRVLLLDKDLKFKQVLLSNEMHGLQNPTRLLLDESSRRLFVADSQSVTVLMEAFPLTEII